MKKVRYIFTLVFALMGIAFLLVGVGFEAWFTNATEGMEKLEGVIVSLAGKYPIIEYTAGGETYRTETNSTSSTYRVGDSYTILADPADPTRTQDPALRIISLVFSVIGFVMLGIALLIHVIMVRSERRLDLLRAYGLRAEGAVTRVYQNRSVQVNHRSPWVVEAECLHPQTRERITAKSSLLWQTRLQPGDKVCVLIDPMNDRLRMVETEGDA